MSVTGVQILGKLRCTLERIGIQPGSGRVPSLHCAQLGEFQALVGREILLPAQDSRKARLQLQQVLAVPQLGGKVLANGVADRGQLQPIRLLGQKFQAPAGRGNCLAEAALGHQRLAACPLRHGEPGVNYQSLVVAVEGLSQSAPGLRGEAQCAGC